MEELLQDIFKEATGPKLSGLRKTCQDALGKFRRVRNVYFYIIKFVLSIT